MAYIVRGNCFIQDDSLSNLIVLVAQLEQKEFLHVGTGRRLELVGLLSGLRLVPA